MPTTAQLYNHTLTRFATGANAAGDTYKVLLYENDATFDATDTTLAAASSGGTEVFGNGWPEGGVTLTGVTIGVHDTNGFKFDADNISQAIAGGTLGPYRKYILVNTTDSDSPPVAFFTRDEDMTVPDGNPAGITWPANGIISVEVA